MWLVDSAIATVWKVALFSSFMQLCINDELNKILRCNFSFKVLVKNLKEGMGNSIGIHQSFYQKAYKLI